MSGAMSQRVQGGAARIAESPRPAAGRQGPARDATARHEPGRAAPAVFPELHDDLAATVIAYIERTPERPAAGAEGLKIAAVAQRTGIGGATLRKWERRYGVR